MAAVSVELVGLSELINELSQLETTTQMKAEQAVTDATNDARDASLPLIRVRTGYLRSRQQVRQSGNSGGLIMNELYNDADYAQWECFGHHTRSGSWVPGQDFMTAPLLVGERSLNERLNAIYG
jgi:hypothetical protein